MKKWSKHRPGAVDSLNKAGDELLTFYSFPKQQWKTIRTTNVIERINEEFRRRVKTQGFFPTESCALVLLYSLVASGQINLRRLDGYARRPNSDLLSSCAAAHSTRRAARTFPSWGNGQGHRLVARGSADTTGRYRCVVERLIDRHGSVHGDLNSPGSLRRSGHLDCPQSGPIDGYQQSRGSWDAADRSIAELAVGHRN